MNLHHHSGAACGSWPKPFLMIGRLVRGLVLCAILLELAASSVAKPVNEKASLPVATIFAPDWASGQWNDEPPTFSLDGQALFFQRSDGHVSTILVSHLFAVIGPRRRWRRFPGLRRISFRLWRRTGLISSSSLTAHLRRP